jgi:hypothetical protein
MPLVTDQDPGPAATALNNLVDSLVVALPPAELETCTGRIAKLLADLEKGAA